jgi:hypothetical protein
MASIRERISNVLTASVNPENYETKQGSWALIESKELFSCEQTEKAEVIQVLMEMFGTPNENLFV